MNVLAAIAALFLPSPVDVAKRATSANPYAPDLPLQFNVARGQNVRVGLVDPIAGLSGSEADYAVEQMTGRSDIGPELLHLRNDTVSRPYSATHPRIPDDVTGRGTGPQTGAYNKGFVTNVPGLRLIDRRWGLLGRTLQLPRNMINGTLLNPTDRAPVPRAMQDAYSRNNPNELRLEDQYGDLS